MADDLPPLAVLVERMRGYEQRQSEARERDIVMVSTLGQINQTLGDIRTDLALVKRRDDEIDDHLEATDKRVEDVHAEVAAINADKRSVAALVASVVSTIGTVATAIWVSMKGTP